MGHRRLISTASITKAINSVPQSWKVIWWMLRKNSCRCRKAGVIAGEMAAYALLRFFSFTNVKLRFPYHHGNNKPRAIAARHPHPVLANWPAAPALLNFASALFRISVLFVALQKQGEQISIVNFCIASGPVSVSVFDAQVAA